MFNLQELTRLRNRQTRRVSSYAVDGGNFDCWVLKPGEARILARIEGRGQLTHLWFTQLGHYREARLRITWDDAPHPSIDCPIGDFFCLGHGLTNSFQNALFAVSTTIHGFPTGAGLSCYLPMPFRKSATVEIVNDSDEDHIVYFYIDYELFLEDEPGPTLYAHAEFRNANPFGGWASDISTTEANGAINLGEQAWRDNYVIVDTKGRGHYIGCNLSVTNLNGGWWGEGDDIIWIDGYKWPPDLHGTGSEDYLGHAWGMQPNAFLRNGSSLHEKDTGGYQTSYVFHLENPVRFTHELKVTIEHGHANHLANEMSSVGYWYADQPLPVAAVPPLADRLPILRDHNDKWMIDKNRKPLRPIEPSAHNRAIAEAARAKRKKD